MKLRAQVGRIVVCRYLRCISTVFYVSFWSRTI